MNIILIIGIAVVAVAIAFIVGFKIKDAVAMSFIIAWLLGAVLLGAGIYLVFVPSWRSIAYCALIAGILSILAGVACYKWNKKQQFNKELDALLVSVVNNMSNNYKDAAQQDFKAFQTKYYDLKEANKLTPKQQVYYTEKLIEFTDKLQGFHH